jgi:two-component system response regulator FixJ
MIEVSTIHLIGDDADVLALAFVLKTAGYAVRAYDSAEAFLRGRPAAPEGCLIVDVRLPILDGIELQRRLLSENYKIPVIVTTAHADVAIAVEAMKLGATDVIEKPLDYDLLFAAISSALDRDKAKVRRTQYSAEIHRRLDALSDRERQVLDGLVAAKSNKVIAHDLQLSVRTIEGYRARMMTKMQVDNLPALIRMMLVGAVDS